MHVPEFGNFTNWKRRAGVAGPCQNLHWCIIKIVLVNLWMEITTVTNMLLVSLDLFQTKNTISKTAYSYAFSIQYVINYMDEHTSNTRLWLFCTFRSDYISLYIFNNK